MTDLFNRLADDILALINAKPASPTKDEVVALLQSYLFVDGQGTALYKLPGQHCELPEPPATNITHDDEAMRGNAAMLLAWSEAWERNRVERVMREEQRKQYEALLGHAAEHINAGDAVVLDQTGWLKRWLHQS